MKKIFLICCIAISAFALSTSASVNRYQISSVNYSVNDTVPSPMTDTMHHNQMDTMHHNMTDTSMMKRDSSLHQ